MALDKTSQPIAASVISAGNTVPTLRQTFNNTQNWTVPTGVKGLVVVLAGGGGSGGTSNLNLNFGAGGGGAGGVGMKALGVTPGTTIGITIGAGGAAVNTTATTGSTGGTTTVNIGSVQLRANGGRGGQPGNNSNGAGTVSPGNFTVAGSTAGTPGATPEITTNFVFDFSPAVAAWSQNTTLSQATVASGNSNPMPVTAGMATTESSMNLSNIAPYSGANSNLYPTNSTFANWVNEARLAGQGGGSGRYDSNQYNALGGATQLNPYDGGSGLVGGGGGATQVNGGYSGQGGGGMGGLGGAGNSANQKGGGGGAGLTGDGANNNGTAGGAGGTGGGGGGGSTHNGTGGGAGGAGAVLIYY